MRATLYSLMFFVFLLSPNSYAEDHWVPNLTLTHLAIVDSGIVFFSTSATPTATCLYWGSQFRFDSNKPGGQQMYAMLLTAKSSKQQVNLSYGGSSTPNTDHNNGCSESTMANVWSISLPWLISRAQFLKLVKLNENLIWKKHSLKPR